MTSWIYIFSKFTPEALLFEALLICVLISSYAAFWVVRKRRFGAVDNEVPSSVVKVYLNELIGEAEDMRTQLFGLLSGGALRPRHVHSDGPGPSFSVSGDAADKLAALEQKMADQASAIQNIMSEKAKLEKELADARASGAAAAPAAVGSEDVQKLQEKCQSLEARLAEYSVIEDDLANLKRLQQENTQLKSQLANGGGASAAAATPAAAPAPAAAAPSTPEPAPVAAAPEAAATTPATPSHSEASPDTDAAAANTATPAPAADAPSSAAMSQDAIQSMLDGANNSPATPANAFEGLVDEVEKSLQPGTPSADAKAATVAAAAPATAAAPETKTEKVPEKTDEDLIAEFEKMLNS